MGSAEGALVGSLPAGAARAGAGLSPSRRALRRFLRHRLAVLGGSLTIEAALGVGTTLFIQVPVPAAGQ